MKAPGVSMLTALLVTHAIIVNTGCMVALAEDEIDDEGMVEVEEAASSDGNDEAVSVGKHGSSDVDTILFFTKPAMAASASVELPAGQITEFLVGFTNKGYTDFVIESLDASLRYPMDFSYHIQNFSAISYQKEVKPNHEATVAYSFVPADAFAGRPIGLTINLAYRDTEGNFFFEPVFNDTVQIIEFDEGFDTEVFFVYVFMATGGVLVLFLGFNYPGGRPSKSKKSAASKAAETGTTNGDVDYEWIPKSALRTSSSTKTSPRSRKSRTGGGAGSASSDDE